MIQRVRTLFVSFIIAFGLAACSPEELMQEVPYTTRLERVAEGAGEGVQYEMGSATESAASGHTIGETAIPESTGAVMGSMEDETQVCFLADEVFPYAYNQLTEVGKLWYRDIEQALGYMREDVRLSEEGLDAGLDEEDIDTVFQCVMNDHPELFYVEGYTYTKYLRGDDTVAISFSGTYSLTVEEVVARKQEIEQAANSLLAGIAEDASDYDKVKYVYDTIIMNTDYDLNALENQNIYSVFVGELSVCQGYAKAAQYLLNRLGVEGTLVQGSVDSGEGHAWNLVKVDGSYYFLDVTWGDASYRSEDGGLENETYFPEINYDYLCVTTGQLETTHKVENCVPIPECMATAANYDVREDALFTFYEREKLERIFQEAKESGRTDVTVKCADSICYQEMKTKLLDNQEIFDFFPMESETISYACNEKQLSLTFWMTNP